jgi:hypothetical protein
MNTRKRILIEGLTIPFVVIAAIIIIPLVAGFVFLPKDYFTPVPDCVNTFGNVDSARHQQEVVRLLESKHPQDFRYFFKTFVEEGESVYMVVNFRNDSQCFDGKIKVDQWDKLSGMRRTNGVSYPKELFELDWRIEETKNGKEITYVDMHRIID